MAFDRSENAFTARLCSFPLGVSIPRRSYLSDAHYVRSTPYQIAIRPQNLHHSTNAVLFREPGTFATFG